MRNKIGVIGAGLVGATAAFALSQSGLASEIVLIDANAQRAQGEALDIEHGAALAPPVLVRDGDYPDLADAHLVIIAAGANQKSGETRLDLAQKNLAVIDSIVPQVARYAPECVLLVVSNPVDVLTWRAAELAGFAEGRVLGSGTVLDTARLRTLLSRHTRVDPRNVHAYVLGEHGDSSFVPWSCAQIASVKLEDYRKGLNYRDHVYPEFSYDEIEQYMRTSGAKIIGRKGATFYAIAISVCHIVEVLFGSTNTVMTVSSMMHGEYGLDDVCLSIPFIVGPEGICGNILPPLTDEELVKMRHSGDVLKGVIAQLDI